MWPTFNASLDEPVILGLGDSAGPSIQDLQAFLTATPWCVLAFSVNRSGATLPSNAVDTEGARSR